jgi:hypothetical protein
MNEKMTGAGTMTIEKIKINGWTVEIDHDPDASSPREDTHGCELVYSHRRYDFPNDAGINFGDFSGWAAVAAHLKDELGALAMAPVYMIDHSGIAFRTAADFSDCDPGQWDSGQIGIAYVTPQNWADTQGTAWTGSEADTEQALKLMAGEVEVYGWYANGETFAYAITDPRDGEVADSCAGYYGYDAVMEAAREAAMSEKLEAKCNGNLDRRAGKIMHSGACPVCGHGGAS